MDEQKLVAWVLQGEAEFLGGQIAVMFSILCRIAKHEEAGKPFAEALELTLKKYYGHEKPTKDTLDFAEFVNDPEGFLRVAKLLGYYFDFDDPMTFAMGGRCDVEGKRRNGDAIFYDSDHIESVHLYRVWPQLFADEQPEPEPREIPATLELGL